MKLSKAKEQKLFENFKKIFDDRDTYSMVKNLVVTTDDGSYNMYDEYVISKNDRVYTVDKFTTFTIKDFFTLRNAVMWAILDKRNLVVEANRVTELDVILEGAMANIDRYVYLSKKTQDLEMKSTYIAKLHQARAKKQEIMEELDDFSKNVNSWQYKKFNQIAK